MNIIGISRTHDASTTVLSNGEILFSASEERLSRIKHDAVPFWGLHQASKLIKNFDHLCIAGIRPPENICEPFGVTGNFYDAVSSKVFKQSKFTNHLFHDFHHLNHASDAFYNSGFKEAVCVVMDGAGSTLLYDLPDQRIEGRESHSIFIASYPANFTCLNKKIFSHTRTPYQKLNINGCEIEVTEASQSLGFLFQHLCEELGFKSNDAGKMMGMAAYGKNQESLKNIFVNGFIRENFIHVNYKGGYFPSYKWENIGFKNTGKFEDFANLCLKVQKETQYQAIEYILKAIKISGCKNVCLSGGYALNCSANYEYLNHLPSGTNLYIEPASNDSGLSVGAAKYVWHNLTNDNTIRKQTSVYLGIPHKIELLNNVEHQKATYDDVADLIVKGNIVAIFQGRSEIGPRALGNRSILFDPRHPDGKAIVNTVKGREWFRPFAGTVLKEKSQEWFNMRGLEESPFMTYAVEVKEDQQKRIPCIVHVDGSCRVQTVTEEQNQHYYRLIQAFETKTGVPILFNTSFNLSGDPMVETIEDAIDTLRRSKLEYLYLPELEILVKVENENTHRSTQG